MKVWIPLNLEPSERGNYEIRSNLEIPFHGSGAERLLVWNMKRSIPKRMNIFFALFWLIYPFSILLRFERTAISDHCVRASRKMFYIKGDLWFFFALPSKRNAYFIPFIKKPGHPTSPSSSQQILKSPNFPNFLPRTRLRMSKERTGHENKVLPYQ